MRSCLRKDQTLRREIKDLFKNKNNVNVVKSTEIGNDGYGTLKGKVMINKN